jgi:hypothetical protein
VIDIDGQLRDIRAAIGFARHHAEIDPERIALWGTSLGGGHAVVVAAEDPRLAAVIAQIPFNGFPDKVEGRPALATVKLLGAALWDAIRGRLGLAPYYVRAVGGQGELAVMATPQAQQTIAAMDSANWRNQVAPRALLQMMRYKPGDHVARLSMPLLVCIAAEDRETPPQVGSAFMAVFRRRGGCAWIPGSAHPVHGRPATGGGRAGPARRILPVIKPKRRGQVFTAMDTQEGQRGIAALAGRGRRRR